MRIDAEAERGQRIERGALPVRPVLALDQQEVGVEVQAAIGDDAGFERAQRSGGGVAGIDGRGKALLLALLVQAQEGGLGHHRFAAHFECLRQAELLSASPPEIVSGTLRMVRMFEVTSSPVWPSPRVMPVSQPRAAAVFAGS